MRDHTRSTLQVNSGSQTWTVRRPLVLALSSRKGFSFSRAQLSPALIPMQLRMRTGRPSPLACRVSPARRVISLLTWLALWCEVHQRAVLDGQGGVPFARVSSASLVNRVATCPRLWSLVHHRCPLDGQGAVS